MERFNTIGKRVLVLAALGILFLMVLDFNNRMTDLTRLREQLDIEETSLAELSSTQTVLQTQIAFATSEAAVEEWARQQGHLVQPGDFPIVPLPDPNYTPEAVIEPTPERLPLDNWQAWLEWFFYAGE